MKDLYKIIINGEEYTEIVEYKEEGYEYNKGMELFISLVEKNLNYEKDNMFYYDIDTFMKDNVDIVLIEKDIKRKIFLLYTGVSGYDTYDSAVITAYTEEEAKEVGSKHLADYFCNASVELIGIVSNEEYNTKSETIVASYRNG